MDQTQSQQESSNKENENLLGKRNYHITGHDFLPRDKVGWCTLSEDRLFSLLIHYKPAGKVFTYYLCLKF